MTKLHFVFNPCPIIDTLSLVFSHILLLFSFFVSKVNLHLPYLYSVKAYLIVFIHILQPLYCLIFV